MWHHTHATYIMKQTLAHWGLWLSQQLIMGIYDSGMTDKSACIYVTDCDRVWDTH